MAHSHPLADGKPSLESLVEAHSAYMLRLSDVDRTRSQELTGSLNMLALLNIAGRVLGSECYRLDKIYEGMSVLYRVLELTLVISLPGGFNQASTHVRLLSRCDLLFDLDIQSFISR
jgi:hypothetical protein